MTLLLHIYLIKYTSKKVSSHKKITEALTKLNSEWNTGMRPYLPMSLQSYNDILNR